MCAKLVDLTRGQMDEIADYFKQISDWNEDGLFGSIAAQIMPDGMYVILLSPEMTTTMQKVMNPNNVGGKVSSVNEFFKDNTANHDTHEQGE